MLVFATGAVAASTAECGPRRQGKQEIEVVKDLPNSQLRTVIKK
jgi:hypothetical protein